MAEAREYYAKEFLDARRKQPTPYMEKLHFSPSGGSADPDERVPTDDAAASGRAGQEQVEAHSVAGMRGWPAGETRSARVIQSRVDLDLWPSHVDGIELIWHRLNRRHDLRRFFRSSVRWAECDARLAPSGSIVASHSAGTRGDRPFDEWLGQVAANGRAAKIDIKEGGPVLDGVTDIVTAASIPDEDLWFNAAAEMIGGRVGFESLRAARPIARRSVAVDTLAAWLLVSPRAGLALLDDVRSWGVDRVSISVQTQMFQEVVKLMKDSDWLVNVWDVSHMSQLEDAIQARPASITADLGILDPAEV